MASPFGSIVNPAETEPIVDGATYVYEHKDANGDVVWTEGGVIMGTKTDAVTGKVTGNLYHFNRGSEPYRVFEGTESFAQWKMVAAPSKSAATHCRNTYKAKLEAREQAKLDAKAARKAS